MYACMGEVWMFYWNDPMWNKIKFNIYCFSQTLCWLQVRQLTVPHTFLYNKLNKYGEKHKEQILEVQVAHTNVIHDQLQTCQVSRF
jgi:hypothetical protein